MKKIITISSLVLCLNVQAQRYGISTIAGTGSPWGFSGDGGQATAATFFFPPDVALDAQGNLYIADYNNGRVREVNASTGIITTVAGGGSPVSPSIGDGGQATAATLDGPISVAFDANNNMYISELNASRIRRVDASTGTITTVAGIGIAGFSGDGGLATAAQLQNPRGIALDVQGNLYIADWFNNRIRKVNISTGIITTVAGGGSPVYPSIGDGGAATSAGLSYPRDVAIDAQGNLYIADESHARVRKVNASTGIITTVAGGGAPVYPATGEGGAATSAIISAACIALDAQGNIYIGSGNRIRKVSVSTGIINTIAGSDTAGFSGDGGAAITAKLAAAQGLATDAQGNIYIADYSNNRVRKLTPCNTITTTTSQSVVCAGAISLLSVSGMTSQVWSNGATTSSTNVTPTVSTTYSVTGTDNIGCPSTLTVNIQTYPLSIISVSSATVCPAEAGSPVVLIPSGASTYSITGGSFTVNPNSTTSYSVTGTNSNGCVSSNTAVATILVINTLPNITISGNDTICVNEVTILSANGANTYTWTYTSDNGVTWSYDSNINVNPSVNTTYFVQGTDVYGCVNNNNTSITLYVNACTGINELKDESLILSVYPNPTSEILNVELGVINGKTEIQIFDLLGKEIIHNSTFSIHNSINVSELNNGIYFIKVGNTVRKLVKE